MSNNGNLELAEHAAPDHMTPAPDNLAVATDTELSPDMRREIVSTRRYMAQQERARAYFAHKAVKLSEIKIKKGSWKPLDLCRYYTYRALSQERIVLPFGMGYLAYLNIDDPRLKDVPLDTTHEDPRITRAIGAVETRSKRQLAHAMLDIRLAKIMESARYYPRIVDLAIATQQHAAYLDEQMAGRNYVDVCGGTFKKLAQILTAARDRGVKPERLYINDEDPRNVREGMMMLSHSGFHAVKGFAGNICDEQTWGRPLRQTRPAQQRGSAKSAKEELASSPHKTFASMEGVTINDFLRDEKKQWAWIIRNILPPDTIVKMSVDFTVDIPTLRPLYDNTDYMDFHHAALICGLWSIGMELDGRNVVPKVGFEEQEEGVKIKTNLINNEATRFLVKTDDGDEIPYTLESGPIWCGTISKLREEPFYIGLRNDGLQLITPLYYRSQEPRFAGVRQAAVICTNTGPG